LITFEFMHACMMQLVGLCFVAWPAADALRMLRGYLDEEPIGKLTNEHNKNFIVLEVDFVFSLFSVSLSI